MSMAYTQARNRATQKYAKAHLDRIYLSVRKGQKELMQAAAQAQGESLSTYIQKAVAMRMEAEQNENA